MTEHHAISRRAFTLGLGLAALSPFVSLPETAGLGLPMRAAFCRRHAHIGGHPRQVRHSPSPRGLFSHRERQRRRQRHRQTSATCLMTARPTSSSSSTWRPIQIIQIGMPFAPCSISRSTRRRATAFGRSTATRTKMERLSTYGVASMTARASRSFAFARQQNGT